MRIFAIALAACCAFPAIAQETTDTVLPPVEVHSKKNPGDVPYLSAYKVQQRLLSLLPAEPRVTDIRMRVLFASLSPAEQDDFMPATWAVAVVGKTFEHAVPVERGGYFLLPEIPIAADEDATLMFNTQTRKKTLSAVWSVRVRAGNVLPYRDFARAIEEFDVVRRKIGRQELSMRQLRDHKYNALRACFANRQGAILIDGAASSAVASGSCLLLKFDPARGNTDAAITFSGELETLTLDAIGGSPSSPDANARTARPELIEELDSAPGKIHW
ncbi:MAG: hypothetical protein JWQ01_4070 [Massilia sp.]|nr:hypothetical protein [Massilia sp.]